MFGTVAASIRLIRIRPHSLCVRLDLIAGREHSMRRWIMTRLPSVTRSRVSMASGAAGLQLGHVQLESMSVLVCASAVFECVRAPHG